MRHATQLSLLAAIVLCAGCRTSRLLPPVDLQQPGWQIAQGQAVWKPTRSRPSLAGELLLATNANGDFFVQFDKVPFPLATAQVVSNEWQIRFGTGEHAWRGRGEPPARFVWFQLPHALRAEPLPRDWKFERLGAEIWRIENRRTGESLEGSLAP